MAPRSINTLISNVHAADRKLERAKAALTRNLMTTARETARLERKVAQNRAAIRIAAEIIGSTSSVDQLIEFSEQKHVHNALREYAQNHNPVLDPPARHDRTGKPMPKLRPVTLAEETKARAIAYAQEEYIYNGFLNTRGEQALKDMRETPYTFTPDTYAAYLYDYLRTF
jgi:hypothetical protein